MDWQFFIGNKPHALVQVSSFSAPSQALVSSLTPLPPGSRGALRVTHLRDLLSAGLPRPGIRSRLRGLGLPTV